MKRAAIVILLLLVAGIGGVSWLGLRGAPADDSPSPLGAGQGDAIARGRYLVQMGDCQACHTEQGGAAFAGGRAIPTPFGNFYSPNITPDDDTGIGRWTAQDFRRALHEGRSRDGSLLFPSFPYTNYTRLTRDDTDAMFAYLHSLPPVQAPPREHQLHFPYDQRLLLLAWRALFFRPGVYEPQAQQDAEWNRGAYLVQGLGHCSACHEARNALGAVQSKDNPAGGLVLNWYAPVLSAPQEAGVQDWSIEDISALLKTGTAPRGSAFGPMAEVVYESLQHGSDADIRAMAVYLKALKPTAAPLAAGAIRVPQRDLQGMQQRGAALYEKHCADCHGAQGQGRKPAAPALAGNRAVTMGTAVNPIRAVLFGGYPPGTSGNPRPFGMPPFGSQLNDEQVAELLTYVRSSWGNQARPLSSAEVAKNRQGPLW
ncbi:MAG TPA: cytochrome c [Solimonas sp.]|nr:cytochrome c [Solimonas sp.]